MEGVGDYTRAMLRMEDDIAAGSVRDELHGASSVAINRRYLSAVEHGDRVTMRVIEAGIGSDAFEIRKPELEHI